MRYELGVQVGRLAEWLKYPRQPECAAPGCHYYRRAGVHQPVEECPKCLAGLLSRADHHDFVGPPSKLRAILTRAARR